MIEKEEEETSVVDELHGVIGGGFDPSLDVLFKGEKHGC